MNFLKRVNSIQSRAAHRWGQQYSQSLSQRFQSVLDSGVPEKCGPSDALSFLIEDYGGVEDGEKRDRWYKRKLETLVYVITKFQPRFMDSAHHVPMWVPSCPRKTATAIVKASPNTVGVYVLGGGVP